MTYFLVGPLVCCLALSLSACAGGSTSNAPEGQITGGGSVIGDGEPSGGEAPDGEGSGDGAGAGSGDGAGDGSGGSTGGEDGAGNGTGSGNETESGDGTSSGDETGTGDDTGSGDGTGDSSGSGSGDGTGEGDGEPDGSPEDAEPAPIGLNIVTEEERALYLGAFLDDFALIRDTAMLGGLTPFDPSPTSGAASYDGYMQVIIGTASVSANVIGDATLRVDLSGGPIVGSATGFLGMTLDDALVNQVVSYEGVIAIMGGGVTEGPTGGSAISFDIDGTLDSGLNTFGINGTLNGYLFGPEGSGLRATGSHGGMSNDIDATVDGSGPTPVGIATVWATKE